MVKHNVDKQACSGMKSQRKSRDHRSRSQDWPDVPDVGKIEENNPEILAQKILEKGRQIEAGKIRSPATPDSARCAPQRPVVTSKPCSRPSQQPQPQLMYNTNNRLQDPPRLPNFEDRLKSIITTVLNEDQQNRSQMQSQATRNTWNSRSSSLTSLHQQQPDYTQVSHNIPFMKFFFHSRPGVIFWLRTKEMVQLLYQSSCVNHF